MSWWRRMLGISAEDESAASAPGPRPMDPWAARVSALEIDALPALVDDLRHEPEVVRRDVLRQARVRLGDHPALLLALARTRPADAAAIWTTLAEIPAHAAEACDALADLATQVGVRQAWLERAAAAAPGDMARVRRCLSAATPATPPALPLGPWPPLRDRLPRSFTPRAPLGRGPSGILLRVVSDSPWTAKGLHADLHAHPGLAGVFDDLKRVQDLDLKGVASIVHLDVTRGCWVRTVGVTTLADRPLADLAPIADALEALHAVGLAHGNVCARNVIIDADDQARLTDLGVARLRGITPSVDADRAALSQMIQSQQTISRQMEAR